MYEIKKYKYDLKLNGDRKVTNKFIISGCVRDFFKKRAKMSTLFLSYFEHIVYILQSD